MRLIESFVNEGGSAPVVRTATTARSRTSGRSGSESAGGAATTVTGEGGAMLHPDMCPAASSTHAGQS